MKLRHFPIHCDLSGFTAFRLTVINFLGGTRLSTTQGPARLRELLLGILM